MFVQKTIQVFALGNVHKLLVRFALLIFYSKPPRMPHYSHRYTMNPKVDKFFNFMVYQGVSKGCNRESYNSLTKIEACKEQVFIFTIKPKKIQDHQIIVVAEI